MSGSTATVPMSATHAWSSRPRSASGTAARLGLTPAGLDRALDAGRLSIRADGSGQGFAGGRAAIVTTRGSFIPVTQDGVPDVMALRLAGAEITTSGTSAGEPVRTIRSETGRTAYWAFEVDLHDGNGRQRVKGGTADLGPGVGRSATTQAFADLLDSVDLLG